ncbi:MAG TPA: sporulation protein YunB [Firmicutes bacterium]|nr:sporulation protein YunB [Bacillota bacterium]
MRWGRRYSHEPLFVVVLVCSLLFIGSFLIIERNIKPTLLALAEAKAKILAIQAINSAVNQEIVETVKYQDLIAIHKDTRGKIVLMQPNTVEISRLASKTTAFIQEQLEALNDQSIVLPLGQVFGSALLANMGPRIRVSVVPLGTVNVSLVSDFKEAGINQTLHQLFLEIEADVQIVIPLVRSTTQVQTAVPLAQTVIVGEVPQQYWQLFSP